MKWNTMESAPKDGSIVLVKLSDGVIEDGMFSKYFGSDYSEWRDARCPERTISPVAWKDNT